MRIPATSSPSKWSHPRHAVYFSFALWLEIHFDSLFCNCGGLPAPFGCLRRGGLPPRRIDGDSARDSPGALFAASRLKKGLKEIEKKEAEELEEEKRRGDL